MKTWTIDAPQRFTNAHGEVLVATDQTDKWKGMEGYDVVFAHSDTDWEEWKVRLPDTLLEVTTEMDVFSVVRHIVLPWKLSHAECLFITSVLMTAAEGLRIRREQKDKLLSVHKGETVTCFVDGPAKEKQPLSDQGGRRDAT